MSMWMLYFSPECHCRCCDYAVTCNNSWVMVIKWWVLSNEVKDQDIIVDAAILIHNNLYDMGRVSSTWSHKKGGRGLVYLLMMQPCMRCRCSHLSTMRCSRCGLAWDEHVAIGVSQSAKFGCLHDAHNRFSSDKCNKVFSFFFLLLLSFLTLTSSHTVRRSMVWRKVPSP